MKPKLAFLLFTLLVVSCQRNKKDIPNPQPRNCRIMEQIMHPWSSTYGYTLTYTYTGNHISRINDSRKEYATFEYAGDLLTKRIRFRAGQAVPYAYELIHYNADSTVSAVERYNLKDLQANIYDKATEVVFAYAGGKMVNVTTFEWAFGVRNKMQEYVYTYTGNNITKVDYTRHWDNRSGFTYPLAYDNLENYVRKRGAQAWLYTSVWDEFYGSLIDGDAIARSQSANNATTAFTGSTLYTPDENQNLSIVWRNNTTDEKYVYKCQ